MAHALQIDTLAFSKKLREAGADEGLAEAIVEGLTAADTSELATKGDLAEVKTELVEKIAQVDTRIAEVKGQVQAVADKLDGMATKVDNRIAEVRTEIAQSANRAIYTLGGLVGILFVLDRIIPLFGVGN